MAVKKTTAKKSVAKKAPAKATKKSAPKKSPVKKSVAKKSAVKKSAVKKSATKKAVVKKATRKKATAKKAATKKSATRRAAETIVIPEAPILASRNARVEIVSTPTPATPAPILASAVPTSVASTPAAQKPGASGRVIFAVVVGIILLGAIVWAKGHNSHPANKANPTPTATATSSGTPTPTPTPSDTAETLTSHEAPQGVVAHYTTTGATIFWKAPTALKGLSGYNVEISVSNGPWKLISTVPATQLSLDVTKNNGNGWTSFKVSSVYTDSETVAAKAFGLPGSYS